MNVNQMYYMRKAFFVLGAIALMCAACKSDEQKLEEKVESYLSQMTLEEKTGIIHAQSKFSSAGVPRLGIPELWTDDGPHGVRPETLWDAWTAAGQTNDSVTVYPSLTCLAATWNRDMADLYGRSVGAEARYRGKDVLLGPGVNIARTPLCGRNFEYMGEDPYLAGEMCVPYIKGVQSNGVAACVKHYCLNNQEFKRSYVNVTVDDRTLYEIYLPAFEKAVKEGHVWSVMGSYNLYKGVHCCHNDITINKILKGEWGFDGALISDWGGVHDTDEAIANGTDLEFGTGTNGVDTNVENAYDYYYLARPYLNKLRSGEVDQTQLDDKCRRVLRLMLRTGMNGKEYYGSMNSPQHSADALAIAREGIVLLKNDNAVLPVSADARKIVVLGENAIKPMAVGGSSSSLKARYELSPLEGIKAAFPDAEVVYERAYQGEPTIKGYNYSLYDLTDPRPAEQMLADALAAVQDADYVIFFGGLNKAKYQDCEGRDRLDYTLPYGQDAVVEALAAVRSDLIYVNVSGSPVAMPWIAKVSAAVQAWYLGSETGNALADVLSGKVNPSGKLPFTFPASLGDCPIRTELQYPGIAPEEEKGIWEQEYTEGIYVGYRWYEAQNIKPLFAFGHGLSYTTFEYGEASLSSKRFHGNGVTVSVPVTNTGKVAGAEVVQVYVSDLEASVDRPVKELKGFAKVYLEPGQTKTVKVELDKRAFSFFDVARHEWVAEEGDFDILVGAASDDIRTRVRMKM